MKSNNCRGVVVDVDKSHIMAWLIKSIFQQVYNSLFLSLSLSLSRFLLSGMGFSGSVMVQKVAVKQEFEAGLRHAATGKLSVSAQQ